MERYVDRQHAGLILADKLAAYAHKTDTLILALPRGGVPVAYEVAQCLSLPLDLLLVRKLGVPLHEELAFGAIASGGIIIFNDELLKQLQLKQETIDRVIQAERQELQRREQHYRGKRPPLVIHNKIIILIDDGMATGASMQAAVNAVKTHQPKAIVIAVPVSAPETCLALRSQVDELICPNQPIDFHAVSLWYEHFPQTSDAEVIDCLAKS
jgi:putative phosphoribosyl transferase